MKKTKVKMRKQPAPPAQLHRKKKGVGSYSRKTMAERLRQQCNDMSAAERRAGYKSAVKRIFESFS